MSVCLGSSCWRPSVLPAVGCMFPSLDLESSQSEFLTMCFQPPSPCLFPSWALYNVNVGTLDVILGISHSALVLECAFLPAVPGDSRSSVFQIPHAFLCAAQSAAKSFLSVFISVIVFFGSEWFLFTFCHSLLKFSLRSSILSPNSVSILITHALNFPFGKSFILVSVIIFSGVFLSLFQRRQAPPLTFLISLYLYEIREGSSLLLLVLQHSCLICVCPVAWVEEMDVMRTQMTSFLGLCLLPRQ